MKLRAFGDVFASFNWKIYDEIVNFERFFVKAVMQNWREMSQKSIDIITRKHMFWAELLSHFADYTVEIDKEAVRGEPKEPVLKADGTPEPVTPRGTRKPIV